MNFKYIYKIIDANEWKIAKDNGSYSGSSKDLKDGYIHFSGEEQVEDTLKKFYQKQKDLILLKVETLHLNSLVWEQASDGNMFPHLYSSLDATNVVDEFRILLEGDKHVLPTTL